MLRIAEDYANLTRLRGGGLNPHAALKAMAGYMGTYYDPILMQAFINKMGLYPPGTLLEVEVKMKGRSIIFIMCVISLVRSPETFATPICRLIKLQDGRDAPPVLANRPIDLAKKGRILKVLTQL